MRYLFLFRTILRKNNDYLPNMNQMVFIMGTQVCYI
jgi:hypothetical protein